MPFSDRYEKLQILYLDIHLNKLKTGLCTYIIEMEQVVANNGEFYYTFSKYSVYTKYYINYHGNTMTMTY